MIASIGIDPGKTGAVVALVLASTGIRCVYQALTHHVAPGLEPALMYRATMDARNAIIDATPEDVGYTISAVLERVGAMPKQGLSSTFHFGHGRGVWAGVLAGHGWHVLEPRPADWSRAILRNIPGDDTKARAIMRASSVAGLDLIPTGCRVPQDGLADACCLALYGLGEAAIKK